MPAHALITGASSGIGWEFSRQLAAARISPVLASRSKEKLDTLKSVIENDYRIEAEVIAIDLSLPGSADALFEECEKRALDIEILINNAGVGMFGASTGQESDKIERMLALNILSLTTLSGRFGAKMMTKGKGRILNVGSFAGNQATPYFASYAASKRYVHDFSTALRYELKRHGVTVTCLVPGFVSTAFDTNAGIANSRYLSFSKRSSLPPSQVARIGLNAMFKGKARVTAGIPNKLLGIAAALIPPRVKAAAILAGVEWIIR